MTSNFDTDVAFKDPATCRLPTGTLNHYDRTMVLSDRQLLDALSRMPFIDSAELSRVLGEAHATVHRALTGLLADGIVARVSHGIARLPSSQRYHLTTSGIGEAARVLGFETSSDFARGYPVSREWLTLLIRRMDAVASIYRLGASMSTGIDGLKSHVEFHRRGRFDATITPHRRYIITPPFTPKDGGLVHEDGKTILACAGGVGVGVYSRRQTRWLPGNGSAMTPWCDAWGNWKRRPKAVTGEASDLPPEGVGDAAAHPAAPWPLGPRSPSSGSDESGAPTRGRQRIR